MLCRIHGAGGCESGFIYIYIYLDVCTGVTLSVPNQIGMYPTLVGATAAVHHDDDCPIRGQLVKSGVVAKLSPRVLPAQIALKSTTNHSKYMKTVKQVNEHIAFQSIFETLHNSSYILLMSTINHWPWLPVVSVVCSLLFLFTGRHSKSKNRSKSPGSTQQPHTE